MRDTRYSPFLLYARVVFHPFACSKRSYVHPAGSVRRIAQCAILRTESKRGGRLQLAITFDLQSGCHFKEAGGAHQGFYIRTSSF